MSKMGSKTENTVIVAGEASESDDEDDTLVENNQTKQTLSGALPVSPASQTADQTGAVVSGEASESDEEYEIITHEQSDLPPLNVNLAEQGDTEESAPTSPQLQQNMPPKSKYNSLLNRKLRERNIALRRHIVETIHQNYTIAGKDIHNLTLQLQKSHIAMQDVSHHMRDTTNNLFNLEDRVDIVTSCNLLPNINMPQKTMGITGSNISVPGGNTGSEPNINIQAGNTEEINAES
ncbi:biogenesis of lysosome-related organelles complex 1 subunit 3-like [Mya arenaria]|nr:biogenesis of lysosome-related organelles complex 1 subunit 3-like [Mya arenaria]